MKCVSGGHWTKIFVQIVHETFEVGERCLGRASEFVELVAGYTSGHN